jgi:hypothetical protein
MAAFQFTGKLSAVVTADSLRLVLDRVMDGRMDRMGCEDGEE